MPRVFKHQKRNQFTHTERAESIEAHGEQQIQFLLWKNLLEVQPSPQSLKNMRRITSNCDLSTSHTITKLGISCTCTSIQTRIPVHSPYSSLDGSSYSLNDGRTPNHLMTHVILVGVTYGFYMHAKRRSTTTTVSVYRRRRSLLRIRHHPTQHTVPTCIPHNVNKTQLMVRPDSRYNINRAIFANHGMPIISDGKPFLSERDVVLS